MPSIRSYGVATARTQFAMLLAPDKSGQLRERKRPNGLLDWERASNLHIGAEVAFSTNTLAAAYTLCPSGGGRAWPSLKMESLDYERATCAWFNSTLGLMCYWFFGNRTQKARSTTSITAIPNMITLDWRALPPSRVASAVSIFNDLCQERLLPASEVYRDPVRQEVDRRLLTEVLMLNDQAVNAFTILRNQWCAEPTSRRGRKDKHPVQHLNDRSKAHQVTVCGFPMAWTALPEPQRRSSLPEPKEYLHKNGNLPRCPSRSEIRLAKR